jgi:hypothetical protein
MDGMLEGALLVLLVVPPLVLLSRALGRFCVQWFRGWPLDPEHGAAPAVHGPAHDPACPSCGQPLAAKARRCQHCDLRLDDASLVAPGRRRLIRF